MSAPIIEVTLRKLRVPIFTRGSREFELSAATSNFLYRFHQPKWVVRPRNGEDVATTVRLANAMNETITVKNGGHSYAGFSNAQGGILVDLCDMKAVQIEEDDDEGRVMVMSAGALWGDAYHALAIDGRQYDGSMVNGGRCPLVGVSGFILGGGFGPFSRTVGMGMDQLIEVDVVNADGNTITVGKNDAAGSPNAKLFWALRGAGGGNFGIVTRLKIKVTSLRNETVVAGRHTWTVTQEKLNEFKQMMVHFYTRPWDKHLTIDTTWECDLTRSSEARPFGTRFIAYYDGKPDGFVEEINKQMPDATHKDFRDQLIRRSLSEKSSLFLHETLFAQWSEENRRSLPSERAYTLYSSFVIKNDDEERIKAITNILADRIQEFRGKFTGERGTFSITWIHVGGEISSKGPTDTPYPWRQGNYCIYIMVRWHEKWLINEMGEFFDACKVQLKPHSIEQKASYVNFADRKLENWSEAYYGENLAELRRIYSQSNPNERRVLHFEQHIAKAAAPRGTPSSGGGRSRGPMLGAPRGGPRGGPGGGDSEEAEPGEPGTEPSADGALKDWRDQWENFTPPGGGYENYVPAADGLLRC